MNLKDHVRKTPHLPQHPEEMQYLLKLSQRAESILEIGSRYGYCLGFMARNMKVKGRVVSVDLPGVLPWGAPDSEEILTRNIQELKDEGYDAHLFLGDSKDKEIIEKVRELGPYDLVFIDGDHSYEGVKRDWETYGPLGWVVVFHDIVDVGGSKKKPEVYKLWRELKGNKSEFIGKDSNMGLGIICQ